MAWIAKDPESYIGEVVGNGQCVAYVHAACAMPPTAQWKRGAHVKDGDVPHGTAIATFEPNGTYGNVVGQSHAAILDRVTPQGLQVWDQWTDQPVHARLIRFQGGDGKPVNDGDRFYVIEHA